VVLLRVEFLLKLIVGIPGMQKLFCSPWQILGVPFALTSIGQLRQSPPSPVPGERARGKRRGFSPQPPRATRFTPEVIPILILILFISYIFLTPFFSENPAQSNKKKSPAHWQKGAYFPKV